MIYGNEREERWREERLAFDAQAQAAMGDVRPLASRVVARYSHPGRLYSKEFRFRLLGNLNGKTVLDAGCNDGENSVLLGRLGASVTGIDISAKAIEVANQRAHINGLAERVRFICSPLELADFPAASLDIIWCHAILHHLIPDLAIVLDYFARWTKPEGLIVINEPVNLCHAFRRLRFMTPFKVHGTPGERPLEQDEIDLIISHLENPRIRYFLLFFRAAVLLLGGTPFEEVGRSRRFILNAVAGLDYFLLSLPGVKKLAGGIVILGRPRRS